LAVPETGPDLGVLPALPHIKRPHIPTIQTNKQCLLFLAAKGWINMACFARHPQNRTVKQQKVKIEIK